MLESDPLERIQTRRHLEEVNRHLLHGAGEIHESPGKLSLIWAGSSGQAQRYLAVKTAGDEAVLINGHRYPATQAGLQEGLRACLAEMD